jgi:hypothetical protein
MSDRTSRHPSPDHVPLPKKRERYCWIGAPEIFLLEQQCYLLYQAFDEIPYLVGSATEHRQFRDVDIRMIFGESKWIGLFGDCRHGDHNPLWSLLCTSISGQLSKITGLKVDFQIQRRSSIKEADMKKFRNPMGIFHSQEGKEPEWMKRKMD